MFFLSKKRRRKRCLIECLICGTVSSKKLPDGQDVMMIRERCYVCHMIRDQIVVKKQEDKIMVKFL